MNETKKIWEIIEPALKQADYHILDGDADHIIITDKNSKTFEIKISEIQEDTNNVYF